MEQIKLLEHNKRTLEEVEYFAERGMNCCVVNPCGSGKTSVMAAFIRRHIASTFLIITKQRNAADYFRMKDPVLAQENVTIVTFAKMQKDYVSMKDVDRYNADYYFVDEAHYIGAEKWSKAFEYFVELYGPVIIGLTATPQRFEDQGTENTIINRYFDGNSAGNYTSKRLERDGVFTEPEHVMSIYNMAEVAESQLFRIEEADISENEKSEARRRVMKIVDEWEKNSSPEIIMKRHIPDYMYKDYCNRILVYCPSIRQIEQNRMLIDGVLEEMYPDKKIVSYRYTSKDPESGIKDFCTEDDAYIKVIYSVDKIQETVHIDDLKVLIMMRPSVSNRIITQQFGRVNNITDHRRALILDMVNNLGNLNTVQNTGRKADKRQRRVRRKEQTVSNKSLRICYDSHYRQLFREVDRVLSRTRMYSYKGFTGTLADICYVNDISVEIARNEFARTGDIHAAIEEAELKSPRKRYILKAYEVPDFTLTEEEKEYAASKEGIINGFIKRRNIKNEDMKQDLYLCFLWMVHHSSGLQKYERSLSIINYLRNRYLAMKREEIRKQKLVNRNAEVYTKQQDFVGRFKKETLERGLSDALETLTKKEKECVVMYYSDGLTLKQIGEIYGVGQERIRQIIAKALRKLRHPSRSRGLKSFIYEYDNGIMDMDNAFCTVEAM